MNKAESSEYKNRAISRAINRLEILGKFKSDLDSLMNQTGKYDMRYLRVLNFTLELVDSTGFILESTEVKYKKFRKLFLGDGGVLYRGYTFESDVKAAEIARIEAINDVEAQEFGGLIILYPAKTETRRKTKWKNHQNFYQ